MPFKATYSLRLVGDDPEGLAYGGVTDPTLRLILGAQGELDAGSVPPASKMWLGQGLALSGGALTIDLTALARGNLPNEDMTGLEVTAFVVVNPAGNGPLTIDQGATNGYPILGAAASEATLTAEATAEAVLATKQRIPTSVAAGARNIDITGTGTETFSMMVVAG